MRRKGCSRAIYKRKKAKFIAGVFCMAAILALCAAAVYIKTVIEPNLDEISRIRAEAIVSRTITKAIAEQFTEQDEKMELFQISRGADGVMEVVQADSMAINRLMIQLSLHLQEHFKVMKAESFEVPTGTLLGSKILSQAGPSAQIDVLPLSVSSMDFQTEFEEQGINQTKYKIYLVICCRVRIVAPFSSETLNVTSTVPVAEAVILGRVPDSYVQVPKEDILDVT